MDDRARAIYRRIATLLPRDFRTAAGADLEDAALACLRRERARGGAAGAALAWVRIVADTLVTSTALRFSSPPVNPHAAPRGRFEALMDNLWKDLLYALRGLRRQPGFTLITVLTLALGIGANTAIFSVVNAVLLRPLGYPQADRLEFITSTFPTLGFDQFWVSLPEFVEFRDHNASFASVGAYNVGAANLGSERPTRPVMALVTPELMPTLGVRAAAGRWFTDEDARPGAEDVAILSWELWQRDFGSDPAVLNRTLMINAAPARVVGIMPRGYDVHDQHVELWLPLTIDPKTFANARGGHFLYLIGRLKDGVSDAQARADVKTMVSNWTNFAPGPQQHIPSSPNHDLRMDPLKQDIVGSVTAALVVLQGAVAFVLLIACANLANLLLARADARQREFAVRSALGARRSRLLGQFVTEGLVIANLAAIAGVALGWAALRLLLTINPAAIPRSAEVALDWRVLAFTLGLTVLTGFVFGLAPLVHLGGALATSLRDGARATGGRMQKAVRGGLVIVEVTLAVVLVVGAGLLVKSFVNLLNVDAGFKRDQLVTFGLVMPGAAYKPEQRVAMLSSLEARLATIPGVQSVASMAGLPPNRQVDANDTDFEWIPNGPQPTPVPGQPAPQQFPAQNVDYWQVTTARYAQTMGIPVVKGRAFELSDGPGPPVVLVNEALVQKFFKDRDPIGQHVKPFGDKIPWFTIIGVVKDVKQSGVDSPAGTEIYWLYEQLPRTAGFANGNMNIVLRAAVPLPSLMSPIRQAVHDLDASLPVIKLRTMDEVFGASVSRPRFLTMLLGIFAGLALLLAAVGTYGVLSYLVTQRQQEIGIRMALGADRGQVLGLVLRQGLILAGAGLVAGVAGALAVGRLLRTLLFNVSPTDPFTIALVAVIISMVAAAACVIPAWRATRVDPLRVLRQA